MPPPTLAPRLMQVTPNYMKSLLTSHDSAQTAFKDMAANAKDAGATEFKVDVRTISGKTALLTYDNGPGPVEADRESPTFGTVTLESFMGPLFNLGGTTAMGDGRKIGQYGVGAITGPLRIGKEVLVATRSADYLYCALLSSSLILEEQTDGILLPYLVYSFAEGVWHENVPGFSFGFFDRFTAFGTDFGHPDLDKLLEVCVELLPAVGGLLHVISNLADEIEVGNKGGDIIMPKLAHAFDSSLSRYLAYAFYKSGDDSNFKITIKGRAVSHLKETGKGPFRETMLKCKKTLPPYKADDTCPNTLPVEADVVAGFTTTEGAGSWTTADEVVRYDAPHLPPLPLSPLSPISQVTKVVRYDAPNVVRHGGVSGFSEEFNIVPLGPHRTRVLLRQRFPKGPILSTLLRVPGTAPVLQYLVRNWNYQIGLEDYCVMQGQAHNIDDFGALP